MIKRHLASLCIAATLALSAGAAMSLQTQTPNISSPVNILALKQSLTLTPAEKVLELFTSQGCSSCPRSNVLLTQFSREPGVLGLTYSVEYWDYLGWRDTFAKPLFSERQRDYSAALGHGRVYTPQIIVNGSVDKPRFNTAELSGLNLPQSGPNISLSQAGALEISSLSAWSQEQEQATIRLIGYMTGEHDVSVGSGENGGRVLKLSNIVTHVKELGKYNGRALSLELPLKSDVSGNQPDAYAVLIQAQSFGPILAAATLTP